MSRGYSQRKVQVRPAEKCKVRKGGHTAFFSVRLFSTVLIAAVLLTGAFALTGCGKSKEMTAAVDPAQAPDEGQAGEYLYGIPMDENAGVISDAVADVYAKPDVTSDRITQAIYNQPVSILEKEQGWARVRTVDGSTGWIKRKYLDESTSSVNGRIFMDRILITSREKSITSQPSGGITQIVAPMGAEFYTFNTSGEYYEVYLPGNKTGWLKGSGVIHIGLKDRVPVTNADDFAATAQRLKGTSYMLNGLSFMGIDAAGLTYLTARINGADLPRTIAGQLSRGVSIDPAEARAGDLVFIAGTGEGEEKEAACVGICIGGGNYLYAGRKTGYVAIAGINKETPEGRVFAARRIFDQ